MPAMKRTIPIRIPSWAAPLVVAVALLASPPAQAQEGLEVADDQVAALVDALKGRPLDREQHDLLVGLGELARTSPDALPGDLLYSGWALVAADRPDLGYDLVKLGLGREPLLATDALRSMMLAVALGQDGLARGIVDLAETINPRAARRLERSVKQPQPLDKASRKARRHLVDLETGAWTIPFGEGQRVAWWVAPAEASPSTPAVVLLPDGAALDGLPKECQSADRLRDAALWAERGLVVVLPGLRGCDGSDGLYTGAHHAAADLRATLEQLRAARAPSRVVLLGSDSAGLLALRLAGHGLDFDAYVAVRPADPTERAHLPPELLASRRPDLRLAEWPDDVVVLDAASYPALEAALIEAGRPATAPVDDALDAAIEAALRGASASDER
jgi:dienelactone hydrolase